MKKDQRTFLLIILGIFVCFFISCQSSEKTANTGEQPSISQLDEGSGSEARAGGRFQTGDLIRFGDTILVVLGWDTYPGGTQFPPDEGFQHLAVDLLAANQGTDPFEFSPGHTLTLQDLSGKDYYMNSMSGYVSGSDNPEAELVPGEIIRGKVGFQVPIDQADFVLIYESGQDDLGEIIVDLGSTPLSLAFPADLDLALQQEIHQIGETAEILGKVIQVVSVSYPADNEITRPKEGFISIVIEVAIENQSEDTLYFTGSDQFYLKDSTGQKYTDDTLALPVGAEDHLTGSLNPGESKQGRIAYLVPQDAGGFIFVFDHDQFEFGKVFISLEN